MFYRPNFFKYEAGLQQSRNAFFAWNSQKHSVSLLYALLYEVHSGNSKSALWDTLYQHAPFPPE